jgi:Uma2 family endonuclease
MLAGVRGGRRELLRYVPAPEECIMSVMALPPASHPPGRWRFPVPGTVGFTAPDLAELPDVGGRCQLVDGTLLLSRPGGFTLDDLDRTPEGDGNRYELIDGTLVVSPAPALAHQFVVARLTDRLRDACPPELFVFPASPAIRRGRRTSVEPDIAVVRRGDIQLGAQAFTGVPVLVVEVLSPSSLARDQVEKRRVYAGLGVPSYWIVDPSPRTGPAVTVLRLGPDAGTYVEVAAVGPADSLAVTAPFPFELRPAELHDIS